MLTQVQHYKRRRTSNGKVAVVVYFADGRCSRSLPGGPYGLVRFEASHCPLPAPVDPHGGESGRAEDGGRAGQGAMFKGGRNPGNSCAMVRAVEHCHLWCLWPVCSAWFATMAFTCSMFTCPLPRGTSGAKSLGEYGPGQRPASFCKMSTWHLGRGRVNNGAK